ncbi:MAG: hypothetical protein KBH07_02165 [Flavobacteriales bacterium]|nr:hypothetical protein [Flavobacteriales bacterium]MBP9078949.1 hypothetical protein [Flavobacteriales bacterium]
MRATILLSAFLACSIGLNAQDAATDSTGLPGDDFSLAGALDLFKQAKDLEGFERALNADGSQVNNLDLDGDGEVDYIRVVDHRDGDAHAIVLQVAVSKDESQDVAVIELEKKAKDDAVLQIRGAGDLYGPDVIVEPYGEEDAGMRPSKGPFLPELVRVHVWVNVWGWPCVNWMYGPRYVVWSSPWYWGYYPPWWRPWRPHPYRVFWGWQRPRHVVYRPVHVCRVTRAHTVYVPRAVHSPRVRTATAPVIEKRKAERNQPANRSKSVERSERRSQADQPGKVRKQGADDQGLPKEKAGRGRQEKRSGGTGKAKRGR